MQFTDGDELSVPASNSSDEKLEQTSNNYSPLQPQRFDDHLRQLRSPINPKFFTGNLENSFRKKLHENEEGKDFESIPITRKTDVDGSELLTPHALGTSMNNPPRKQSSKFDNVHSKSGTNVPLSSFQESGSNLQEGSVHEVAKMPTINPGSEKALPRTQTRKSLLRMISFNRRSSIFVSHKPLKVQSTKKAIDLIRDKACNLYVDETHGRGKKQKAALAKFRNIMKKHAKYDQKAAGFRFFDLTLNAVAQMKQNILGKVMTKFKKKFSRLKKVRIFFQRVIKEIKEPVKPDSSFHLIWDILLMLFIMHDLIVLPFNMSFEQPLEGDKATNILENAETWFFLADLALNFHTAFYRDGNLVMQHKAIFLKYIQSWFVLDVISSFPFSWLTHPLYSTEDDEDAQTVKNIQSTSRIFKIVRALRFIKVVRVVRVVKLKKILDRLDYFVQYTAVINAILSLLKLSAVIFFLAHWCACIWYLIGANGPAHNWVADSQLEGESIANRYIASLYFTITTMMTVGYGDIVPSSTNERIFATFMMILGGGVFGYIINSIAMIVQSIEGEKSKAKKKLFMITRFMQRKGLTKEVQGRVRKYLELQLDNEDGVQKDEAELLGLLSENLKEEVFQQINGKFLNETPSFHGSFSTKFLHSLSIHLKENTFSPEETIYSPDETDFSIYFVSKGFVGIFYKGFSEALEVHKRGGHFGEISFFTAFAEPIIAKSVNFSHVISLQRTEFVKLLEKHDLDNEMFHMIKDKVNLHENYSSLQLKCQVCELSDHPVYKCHKVHYRPKIQQIVERYLKEEQEFNKAYVRTSYRTKNAKHWIGDLESKASDLGRNYPAILQNIATLNDNTPQGDVLDPKSIPSLKKLEVETSKYSGYPSVIPASQQDLQNEKSSNNIKRSSFLEANPNEIQLIKNSSLKSSRKYSNNDYESSIPDGYPPPSKRGSKKRHTFYEYDFERGAYVQKQGPFRTLAEEELIYFEFDRVKNFQIYLPHNNASKIIARLGVQSTDKIFNPFQAGGETEYLKLKLGAFFQRNGLMRKSFELKSIFPKVDVAKRRKSGI